MATGARAKSRAAMAARKSKRGATAWYAVAAIVVVLGVILIAANRGSDEVGPVANKDHWHAAFGVNVCGTWLDNAPEFHSPVANANVSAGVHSHGDGLIHLHPWSSDEAGERATVGKFLSYGGWDADEDSFFVWDSTEHTTGDACGDAEASVRWSVNGEERDGNISDFRPQDGDIVALALLPEGAEIGTPPAAQENLENPVDVEPEAGVTVPPPGDATTTTAPGTTAPGDTTATTTGPATTAPGGETPTTAAP